MSWSLLYIFTILVIGLKLRQRYRHEGSDVLIQGLKCYLALGPMALGSFVLIAYFLYFASLNTSQGNIGILVFLFYTWCLAFLLAYNKWRGGKLLTKVSPPVAVQILGILVSLGALLLFPISKPFLIIASLGYSAVILLIVLQRFDLREEGIYSLGNFIPWSEVRSFDWIGKSKHTLALHYVRQFPCTSSFAFKVPDNQKELITQTLKEHIVRQ